MAKNLEVIGKVAYFTMAVKGGDLPSAYKTTIDVEMDFEGATEAQLIACCASGQSARVALQGQLRKESTTTLDKYQREGLKIKFVDVLTGPKPTSPRDALAALSKGDFIELMTEDYDMDVETAEIMYNKKHGIDGTV